MSFFSVIGYYTTINTENSTKYVQDIQKQFDTIKQRTVSMLKKYDINIASIVTIVYNIACTKILCIGRKT